MLASRLNTIVCVYKILNKDIIKYSFRYLTLHSRKKQISDIRYSDRVAVKEFNQFFKLVRSFAWDFWLIL